MDAEKFRATIRKDLTKSDEADMIWSKLKDKAANMGFGTLQLTAIVRDKNIVEIRYRPSEIEECIRA